MRRVFVAVAGLVLTNVAIFMVKASMRQRKMDHKLDQLQEKFRGLDELPPGAAV